MGAIIKSVAISRSGFRKRILGLITRSARRCLASAGISIQETGMLINTGVYSENHMGEPALAAMIQNKLQFSNLLRKTNDKKSGYMFSFDLKNGGGGLIAAIQVIDGFIQAGTIEYGLIVAGDTKPFLSENYFYSPAAGAFLLSAGSENTGFIKYFSATYPDFKDNLRSATNWDSGKFRFVIDQKNDFLKNCVDCAADSTRNFFDRENLTWNDIDLLITSQSPKGFGRTLQKKLGFKGKLPINGIDNEIYSAGPIFSLNKVFYSNRFKKARTILFLTVGAGISVSLSLYRNY